VDPQVYVLANHDIEQMFDVISEEVLELIDMISKVKAWIQVRNKFKLI
jgi:hypothetical protein